MNTDNYPNFDYKAPELSAFSFCIDTFIISLKNGLIIQFVADDTKKFKDWLAKHKIRDIRIDSGIPEKATVIKTG